MSNMDKNSELESRPSLTKQDNGGDASPQVGDGGDNVSHTG